MVGGCGWITYFDGFVLGSLFRVRFGFRSFFFLVVWGVGVGRGDRDGNSSGLGMGIRV